MSNKTVVVETRAKAFTGQGVQPILAQVDGENTVRVYDSVARHYTTRHALGKTALARIRRLAQVARKDFAAPEAQSARPHGVYGDY